VTLSSHRDTAGDFARQAIVDEWAAVKGQLGGTADVIEENGRSVIRDSHIFGNLDQPEVRGEAFGWLAEFVNVMRPRVRSAQPIFIRVENKPPRRSESPKFAAIHLAAFGQAV
jgi:hypothetical protein